jgi:N-acetylglutamate synthase-like GNAT family acetyltransferase
MRVIERQAPGFATAGRHEKDVTEIAGIAVHPNEC